MDAKRTEGSVIAVIALVIVQICAIIGYLAQG
jgi:hypothetical protein